MSCPSCVDENGFLSAFELQATFIDFCHIFSLTWMKGEPSFHLFGFIMCIGATAARALKTVLQGVLLSSEA